MKKFLLGIMALGAMSAYANDQMIMDDTNFEAIYKGFTVDNKTFIYTRGYNNNQDIREYSVYDSQLNLVKKINIPDQYKESTVTECYRKYVESVVGTYYQDRYNVDDSRTFTEEEAIQYIGSYQDKVTVDGVTRFIMDYLWLNGAQDTNYPRYYYELQSDGQLYRVTIEYETRYSQTGPWDEERTYTEERNYNIFNTYLKDFVVDIDADSELTQTLFNNDASFEYIRPYVEARTYTDYEKHWETGIEYHKRTVNGYRIVGFEVVSETGNVLQTVKFQDGFYTDYSEAEIWILDNQYYLAFDGKTEGNDDYCTLIYKVGNNGAGIAPVNMISRKVSVNPSAVNRSSNVNVKLDQPAEKDCQITVVSATGAVVYKSRINAGATSAVIPASGLSQGVYVVNVTDGKSVKENCKIVVR